MSIFLTALAAASCVKLLDFVGSKWFRSTDYAQHAAELWIADRNRNRDSLGNPR